MYIETTKKTVNCSAKEVFDFLSDVKNFKKLMPENLNKFEVLDENTFNFGLSGMPEITLERKEQHPNSEIIFGAASDKLPFTLACSIIEISSTSSEVQLSFEGEFNAMMAMMIKSPITNFLNTLSKNMEVIAQ